MRNDAEDRLDPNKPALIVIYGATKRKHRPLVGEITVLGRNPTCDVGLVSPEVAPVHCVIVRVGSGWRIRDCSGRATRVNGKSVQDEPLNNGDVIQVGTFSFEAHLPPPAPRAAARSPAKPKRSADVGHLQASRRRLADLALGLRRRLQDSRSRERDLGQRESDLAQLERRLRAATQGQQGEKAEAHAQLDQRKSELDHFAKHLRRAEHKLRDLERQQLAQVEADRVAYESDLMQERVELERERRETSDLRALVAHRHAELEQTAALLEEELSREKDQLERDREQLAGERAYLDEQRAELVRMRAEMERRAEERPAGPVTAEDTRLDDPAPDRLASARRMLRQLAERRAALEARHQP